MQKNQIISILLLFAVSLVFSLLIVLVWLVAHALELMGGMFGILLFVGIFSLLIPVTIITTIVFELLIQTLKLPQLSTVTTIIVALSFTLMAILFPYITPYIWATVFRH